MFACSTCSALSIASALTHCPELYTKCVQLKKLYTKCTHRLCSPSSRMRTWCRLWELCAQYYDGSTCKMQGLKHALIGCFWERCDLYASARSVQFVGNPPLWNCLWLIPGLPCVLFHRVSSVTGLFCACISHGCCHWVMSVDPSKQARNLCAASRRFINNLGVIVHAYFIRSFFKNWYIFNDQTLVLTLARDYDFRLFPHSLFICLHM